MDADEEMIDIEVIQVPDSDRDFYDFVARHRRAFEDTCRQVLLPARLLGFGDGPPHSVKSLDIPRILFEYEMERRRSLL